MNEKMDVSLGVKTIAVLAMQAIIQSGKFSTSRPDDQRQLVALSFELAQLMHDEGVRRGLR